MNGKRGLWQGYSGGEPSDCTHLVTALFESEEYHSSPCLARPCSALHHTVTTTTSQAHLARLCSLVCQKTMLGHDETTKRSMGVPGILPSWATVGGMGQGGDALGGLRDGRWQDGRERGMQPKRKRKWGEHNRAVGKKTLKTGQKSLTGPHCYLNNLCWRPPTPPP